jgi:DNA-binding transcriptional LysR family regulator
MLATIELRYFKAAVTLAEELSFTRAAALLHITQPALSRQIAELEHRLGFSLFKRNHKKVTLTDAGSVFVAEARSALQHVERAIHLARAADSRSERVLILGRSPYTDPALVESLFAVHLPLYPTLRIQLESAFGSDLVQSISNAELDLAIVTEAPDIPGLIRMPIEQVRLYVALPDDHVAASKKHVGVLDLANNCWAIFVRRANPKVYDCLIDLASTHGVHIAEIQHVMSLQEVLPLVADQGCIAFVSASTARLTHYAGVVFRPMMHDELLLQTFLILRSDNTSRLVNQFARAYLRLVKQNPQQGSEGNLAASA